MMSTTADLLIDTFIFACAFSAVAYGYLRWRAYRDWKELLWLLIGSIMIAEVTLDYSTRYLLAAAFDHRALLLVRSAGALIAVASCVGIFIKYRLE